MPTQVFSGSAWDVASLSYERSVDDARLDPPPGGWVNGLARWQEDVISTQANEWTGTFIMNNQSPHGEQTALYVQANGKDPETGETGGWTAGLVVEANNSAVTAEFDGRNVKAILNPVAYGSTDAAIRIDGVPGAHIGAGLEITAKTDAAIVVHGTEDKIILENPDAHWAIGQVNIPGEDAIRLIGVSGLGTDHQHAAIIA